MTQQQENQPVASTPKTTTDSVTDEAFLVDRQAFLSSFLNFTTGTVAFLVVLLILLWFFLT